MMLTPLARLSWRLTATVLCSAATVAAAADPDPPDWEDVQAIFQLRCVNCHGNSGAGKGLRLDSFAAALKGSDNGPVLRPGDVSGSELARRLKGESKPRMPFLSRPLPPEEIDIILRWIAAGLPEARP